MSPTGKSYSFRSCVRAGGRGEAKLRAGARRRCFRGWVSGPGIVLRRRVPVGRVPSPWRKFFVLFSGRELIGILNSVS